MDIDDSRGKQVPALMRPGEQARRGNLVDGTMGFVFAFADIVNFPTQSIECQSTMDCPWQVAVPLPFDLNPSPMRLPSECQNNIDTFSNGRVSSAILVDNAAIVRRHDDCLNGLFSNPYH